MNMKDSIKLAAVVIGTSVTGRPSVQVAKKILPMRAGWTKQGPFRYTTRLIHDGDGRTIEEVRILSGPTPKGAPRFFLACQAELNVGGNKRIISVDDPIPAETLDDAFAHHDATLRFALEAAQKTVDAEVEKYMAAKAEAEKAPHPYSAEANPNAPKSE